MPLVRDNRTSSHLTRSVSPQNSASPLISPDQREESWQIDQEQAQDKNSKRQLFGFVSGKKKSQVDAMAAMDVPLSTDTNAAAPQSESPYLQPAAELKKGTKPLPISPRLPYSSNAPVTGSLASSPGRFRSASPRLSSPASSEIFERNVQEPVPIASMGGEPSAHLPTHVITEDHIPPALEASAQAITSQELNPDEVKIVMSSSHQPAGASLEGSTSQLDTSGVTSPVLSQKSEDVESGAQSQLQPTADEDSNTYGSIDPNDVRRLSFISFADVVQSEHQHPAAVSIYGDTGSRENISAPTSAVSPSTSQPISVARAPSPMHSPRSPASSISHPASGVATPPLVAARAIAGAESSPSRGIGQSGAHGELTIETMRQAVRKTASGDLGQSFRSPALSPVLPNDETSANRTRTNS